MTTKSRLVAGAALLLAFAAAAAGAALETAAPSTVGVSAARLEQIGAALRAEVQQGAIPGAAAVCSDSRRRRRRRCDG
jgi:hypothetical protein